MSQEQVPDNVREAIQGIVEQKDEGGAGGGEFFKKGKYKATLLKSFAKSGYKGFSLQFYFRIDEAIKTGGNDPSAPGSTAKLILKTKEAGAKGTMARLNAQRLARAFFNLPENAPAENVGKALATLLDKSQPCRGMAISIEAYDTQTVAGRDIVACSFEHDPRALTEETARRRAALDSGT